jgi:hypothetical protein
MEMSLLPDVISQGAQFLQPRRQLAPATHHLGIGFILQARRLLCHLLVSVVGSAPCVG